MTVLLAPVSGLFTHSSLWRNLSQEPGLYVLRASAAILVAILALVVGRILFSRVRAASVRARIGPNPALLLARLTRLSIWLLGLLWILAIFKVPFTALAAIVGVSALALSLSLQDLLKNLIAGIYLLAERPFHIGDRITVGGVSGVIDDIQMRVTYLHNDQGERVVMPNQTVFTQVIVNNSVAGGRACVLTVDCPPGAAAADTSSRLLDAVVGCDATALHPSPTTEICSASPEMTRWTVSAWLRDGQSATPMILAVRSALPEASVTLGSLS